MTQPNYHLRPHKSVDRNLFCEAIRHFDIRKISEYRYIGFGSYEFDEFKLFHRNFGIQDMHSIEADPNIYSRQKFNKPYDFIKLYNKKCSDYIDEDFETDKRCIFWMDFSDASDKESQFEDISNLISKTDKDDIVRVTLNAQASSITVSDEYQSLPSEKKRLARFSSLKNSLSDIFPATATEEYVTNQKYPYLLLELLHNASYKNLSADLIICPICAYVYSDGQQMLTVTMLIMDYGSKERKQKEIEESFSDWLDFVNIGSWKDIVNLALPSLTIHEQISLSQIEKTDEKILEASRELGISERDIRSFFRFIRYYPNYQHVIL